MERLTKRLGNGLVRPFIDGKPVPMHYMDMKDIQARLDRLAAYEDTGLTPNEILEMEAEWCALKQLEAERRAERQEAEE